MRKHGSVVIYSRTPDHDVPTMTTGAMFYHYLEQQGWWLDRWLASLSEQQRQAAAQARSQAVLSVTAIKHANSAMLSYA